MLFYENNSKKIWKSENKGLTLHIINKHQKNCDMKKIEFFKKDRKKFADIHGMEYRYSGKEGVGYFVSVKKVQINKLINDRAKAKSLSGSKIAGLIK